MARVSALILEWVSSDLAPFHAMTSPGKFVPGYLSTAEVHERLLESIDCGDVDYDGSELLAEADVGGALAQLYARQREQFEPLGMLSRHRFGVGRLWRIVPPSDESSGQPDASGQPYDGLTHKLFGMINEEDAAERSKMTAELLQAAGSLESLCPLLTALASAAAPLADSSFDLQLLLTVANDVLCEAEACAQERLSNQNPADGAVATGAHGSSSPASGHRRRPRRDPARNSPIRGCRSKTQPAEGEENADVTPGDSLRVLAGELLRKALSQMLSDTAEEDELSLLRSERDGVVALACSQISSLQRAAQLDKRKVAANQPHPHPHPPPRPSHSPFPCNLLHPPHKLVRGLRGSSRPSLLQVYALVCVPFSRSM